MNIVRKIIYLILTAGLVITGCSGNNNENNRQGSFNFGGMQRATTVEATEIERSSISQLVRAYGTVRTQDNVRVTPQISERITSIHADLGDTVSQGQLLVRLRDVNFLDQVKRDRAQVEQARLAINRDSLELARAETLYERNLISNSELQNALVSFQNSRASLESARAALTQSTENLGFTEVRSPVNGVVTRRNISPGDLASSGAAIFEIANLLGYEMRVFLPLADRRLVRIGQDVNIRLTGERIPSAVGVVSRISPELDPVTGLAEVVISIVDTGAEILPGSLAEASVTVRTNPSSIVIPRGAMIENVQTILDPESNTIRLDRSYAAFVAVGDTVASLRQLETGLMQGDRVEVLSGLSEGEKLIITGQGGLEEGSRIRLTGRSRPGTGQERQIDLSEGQQREENAGNSNN
jgi:RND family efflux transporter MFP subunit